jgi:hypothetical protein
MNCKYFDTAALISFFCFFFFTGSLYGVSGTIEGQVPSSTSMSTPMYSDLKGVVDLAQGNLESSFSLISATVSCNQKEGYTLTLKTEQTGSGQLGFKGLGSLSYVQPDEGSYIDIDYLEVVSGGGNHGNYTWNTPVPFNTSEVYSSLGSSISSGDQTKSTVDGLITISGRTSRKTTLLSGTYQLNLDLTYTSN